MVAALAPEVEIRSARLVDGRDVAIRGATTTDLAGIMDFFERLSAPSRYMRFFSPQPRLRHAMIERVVAPGGDRATLLAQPEEFRMTARRVVAVAGWIHLPKDDRCDISIAVADAWQGALLGTYLVLAVLQHAVSCGHTRFSADVLGGNARMLGLLRDLGAPLRTTQEAGVVRLDFELADPGAPARSQS
ncbi:MAG: GNAT family N-acetyltransferase [Candidatus Binatia bacterium]